jgi:hypothetical protein
MQPRDPAGRQINQRHGRFFHKKKESIGCVWLFSISYFVCVLYPGRDNGLVKSGVVGRYGRKSFSLLCAGRKKQTCVWCGWGRRCCPLATSHHPLCFCSLSASNPIIDDKKGGGGREKRERDSALGWLIVCTSEGVSHIKRRRGAEMSFLLTDGGCRAAGEGQLRHICRREKKDGMTLFLFWTSRLLGSLYLSVYQDGPPSAHRY